MQTLTAGVVTAIAKTGLTPVTLIKIDIPANGVNAALTLRLSERGASGGNDYSTPGNTWKALIEDVDRTATLADAQSGVFAADSTMRFRLTNLPSDLLSPDAKFSSLDKLYKLNNALVTVYTWFEGEGLAETDLVVEFVGNISEPFEYNEKTISFDVVSVGANILKKKIGRIITKEEYPEAPDTVLGTFDNVVFGECPKVPCKRVNAIGITSIRLFFLSTDTTLNVSGPLDDFPASGTLEINGDKISYTGKTSNSFTGVTGATTDHYLGEQAVEFQDKHKFNCASTLFPIKSIDAVYTKDGEGEPYQLIDPSEYTLDLIENIIEFNTLPTAARSTDSRFLKAHFDNVEPSNTAANAENAIDPDLLTSVSTIDSNTPSLVVKQADDIETAGEISRVFVAVTYWQEEKTPNDSFIVSIDGVGTIGTLDKQAEEDAADVAGSTDISSALPDNMNFPIDVPVPAHTNDTSAHQTLMQGASSGPIDSYTLQGNTNPISINFPNVPGSPIDAVYSIGVNVESSLFSVGQPEIKAGNFVLARWNFSQGGFDYFNTFTVTGAQQNAFTVFATFGIHTVTINISQRYVRYIPTLSTTPAAQNTDKGGGVFDLSGIKSLSATTEKSSNVQTKLIDITDTVAGDWAWFKDKVLRITLSGSSDGRALYVALARFNIEFAQITKLVTDRVYVDMKGVRDDAAGTITGTSEALIEKPHHFFAWALDVGVAAKKDTTIDLSEGGGVLELAEGGNIELAGVDSSYVNATSFSAAGVLFDAAIPGGYKIAGILDDLIPLSDFFNTIGVNTRSILYFKRGEAHIFFRPVNGSTASTTTIRNLDKNSVFLLGQDGQEDISVEKSPGDDIVNYIDLLYAWDWGEGQFKGDPITFKNELSIGRYGEQKAPANNGLHWVRETLMAEDLAEFFVKELMEPFKVVTFRAPITQMELEIFDIIGFRHALLETAGGSYGPAIIIGINRQVGAGKSGKMDDLEMVIRFINTGKVASDGFGLQAFGSDFGGKGDLDA